MVEGDPKIHSPLDLPPVSERPINFQYIFYGKNESVREGITEVSITLTAYFGKRVGEENTGMAREAFTDDEIPKCEAKSFAEAAQKLWERYSKCGDEEKIEFVKNFINAKWKELNLKKKYTENKDIFEREN
ncbi:MAG TPA: hypothetical protein VFI61_02935 [Patescibacteria group bacterium]|nr:hypothetical protein [Patescibacteria group bacterium]